MVKGRSRALGAMMLAALLALPACSGDREDPPKIQSTVRAGVAPTPPAKGAYFGAWVDPVRHYPPDAGESPSPGPSAPSTGTPSPSDDSRVTVVRDYERDLGRRLDIAAAYRSWTQDFPRDSDADLLAEGRYLLLTWEGADTREIVAGRHDDRVRDRARALKKLGKPVFLRWQPGMDASSQRGRVHSAADYTAAWRHLREIFRQERVDNVAWVWCPTASGFSGGSAHSYYPGDDQVDWIAVDVYPGGDYDYRDFSEAAAGFMDWAEQRPKPVMISEFGVPRSYGERRAEWLRKAATHLQHPQVKAVVYFDSDEGGRDEKGEPRYEFSLAGDAAALSALREMATAPFFNPRNLPVASGG
ncbi:glycoside hydrolase family 26 protein [Thermomonospora amylolytica]|uniref:glycoside hydrolase family 26 protein n=1 Tax=Thermomonospora amylolytica TaxID=1411117 RepID=UPI001F2EA088|nr:glycosyl hydrolase [Thermomonospora amylolytica]